MEDDIPVLGSVSKMGFVKEVNYSPDVKEPFIEITHIFHKFHPKTSPVLWRILVTKAQGHLAIKKVSKMKEGTSNRISEVLEVMPIEDRRKYLDWRQSGENIRDDEVLVQPFDAVENYFRMYLSDYVEESS